MLSKQMSNEHRAKLFAAICQIAVAEVHPIDQKQTAPGARLRPVIAGYCVIYRGRSLDLSAAPMTLDLFRTFLESDDHRATRFDIARKVYGIVDPETRSERFWASTKINITKLISRARKLAAAQLSPSGEEGMTWFTFNPTDEYWDLYALKKETHPEWVH
jgi:hypothetical protein